MAQPFLIGAVALGAAGWLCGLLLTGRPSGERRAMGPAAYVIAAVGAVVALAAVTVPRRAPWPGAGPWGEGVAVGGIAALLAGYAALRASGGSPLRWAAAVAAPCFAAVAAAAGALLWIPTSPVETFIGLATGWFLVTLLLYVGLSGGHADQADTPQLSDPALTVLVSGLGFAAALCATIALGHFRDSASAQAARWTIAAVGLAAGVPTGILLSGALAGSNEPSARSLIQLGRAALPAAVVAALGYLVFARVLPESRLLSSAAIGVAASYLQWWLLADGEARATQDAQAAGRSSIQGHSVLAVLVIFGALIVGFYLLAGYGTGLVLLAAWLPAGILLAAEAANRSGGESRAAEVERVPVDRHVAQLLLFGVILLLYRVFIQRFEDELAGALLTDHFAIFSIMLGALIPVLLADLLRRTDRDARPPAGRQIVRLTLAVTAALALPAGLLVLWGPRAAIGLLTGFMLGVLVFPDAALAAMIALGTAALMAQWTHPLLHAAAQTRAEKARILLWLAGIVAGALLATDLAGRLFDRLRRRGRSAAAAIQEGAEP
jgi:hypothetical protein